jgi:Iap family predicted aminopeptidase
VARAEQVGLRRWRLGAWTDPVLAALAGMPTVSILSVREGGFPNYHLPSDTPENVDMACVEQCVNVAERIAVSA